MRHDQNLDSLLYMFEFIMLLMDLISGVQIWNPVRDVTLVKDLIKKIATQTWLVVSRCTRDFHRKWI